MRDLRSWLTPPTPEADPKETLRWVRKFEVIGGVALVVGGLTLWDEGWVHWALIGLGLLSLSPWPGAQRILRKAEREPDVLVTDPDRRRARARRVAMVQIPLSLLTGTVLGYLLDGWPAAAVMGALMGGGAALGAWWFVRREKT